MVGRGDDTGARGVHGARVGLARWARVGGLAGVRLVPWDVCTPHQRGSQGRDTRERGRVYARGAGDRGVHEMCGALHRGG